jgi:hypothetical protein
LAFYDLPSLSLKLSSTTRRVVPTVLGSVILDLAFVDRDRNNIQRFHASLFWVGCCGDNRSRYANKARDRLILGATVRGR